MASGAGNAVVEWHQRPSNSKNPVVFFDVTIGTIPAGRIKMELFANIAPKIAENFRYFHHSFEITYRKARIPIGYKGCQFLRVIKDFMIQAGDFVKGDGSGCVSIYGSKFEDENFVAKHTGPGLLSMVYDGSNQGSTTVDAIRNGREILFQAFNWESHKHDWWRNLERKVPDLSNSGFTSLWLPPPTNSFSPEGYLPQNLYSLNSCYGSEQLLKSLLQKMQQYKIRAMADIVINHCIGTTKGHAGRYNRYDGIPLSWDEHAVTSCTGGLYVEQSKPVFSVGEYWDSCNYSPGLDYNQDSHRQRIINWIDNTGGLCAAFDFTTKGNLQEAVKGELWRLRDCQGKSPGLMGWWPSRAVTFIENHDTGSTQAHWPFPSSHVMEGYAYILTHPGIPTVFYDHFYDWGHSMHDQIVKLMNIRRSQDIHSRT
ncbi:hypothetical protein H6P81_003138 [Aristolochia fimbriata]|uniref:1,4-alpha-D-glucan glucanohydrolase n=1 Tax=Aristolochia fimbriata TaxID=158543 RepID=A0AAV7FBP9_ARIFI|nr:hypothetical protein H6P81_003138 [Aristolochia fimbriata]